MISGNTARIIGFLMRHSYELGYNVNQIAKALNVSVSRTHEIIMELKTKKMLKVIDLKNAIYYNLDLSNPDTQDTCKMIIREERRTIGPTVRVYSEELKKFEESKFTIIFGSILEKADFKDVDILFITNKVKAVNSFCLSLTKIRSKVIHPIIMPKEDFINNIKKKDKVVLEIIKKGLVIKGEDKYVEALKNGQN